MSRNLDFLYELGTLRNVQRGWRQHVGMDCANVLDHTMRVIWLSLIITRMEKSGDENKIIKMALVHDIAEIRTSDLSYVQKVYNQSDEDRAAQDTFEGTNLEDFYSLHLKEYEARQSIESKIIKDADNLDVELELKELEERGSKLPEKWRETRKFVRDTKLYTESAKKLWDEIAVSNVSAWHLSANKWLKIPNAGK
jgi:putative hydrolases of HD superfamily